MNVISRDQKKFIYKIKKFKALMIRLRTKQGSNKMSLKIAQRLDLTATAVLETTAWLIFRIIVNRFIFKYGRPLDPRRLKRWHR
jgi:hypothetical protein